MSKSMKKIWGLLAVGISLITIAGCTKASNANGEKKEFAYVPNYIDVEFDSGQISKPVMSKDALYVIASTMSEQTGTQSNNLCKYNLLDGTSKKWPLVLDENTTVSYLTVNPEGNICAIAECASFDDSGDAGTGIPQKTIEMLTISSDTGEIVDKKDITSAIADDPSMAFLQNFCMDKNGNYYINVSGQTIAVLDKGGNKTCDISVPGWNMAMATSKEGDVYITTYGQAQIDIQKVDLGTKSLSAPVEGMNSLMLRGLYTGTTHSFVMNDMDNAVYFDVETGKTEQLFAWLDEDINSDNVISAGEMSDGKIWALLEEREGAGESASTKNEIVCLSKVKASELPEKEIITFATLFLNPDIKSKIIDFNKTNDKYRISVNNYSSSDDLQDGANQLSLDIVSSNCPDIIDITAVNFQQFVQKGVFEDLYPYMKKSNIVQEDYLENVLKAYEVDGKLYGVMPQFFILTTLGKESKIGDRSGWSLQEMLDMAMQEENKEVLMHGSKENALYYCLQNSMNDFIDWKAGKCSFEGEDFARVLEFASQFPDEPDYNSEEGTAQKIHSDKALLLEYSIGSVQEYQMISALVGEKISFVGYPNQEKKGNLMVSYCDSLGIAAKSKHKDGAWDFVKLMLSDEFQNEFANQEEKMGFPIKKSALDTYFESCMTPTYSTDENGNKVEEMKGTWGYDDFSMDFYSAKQEDIDGVRALIESAQLPNQDVDKKLIDIIIEEATPFFNGQKTSAEVASVIQNRIQVYVSENK